MPTDDTAAPGTPTPTDDASATTIVVPAAAAAAGTVEMPDHVKARADIEGHLRTDGFAQATRAPRTTAVTGAPITR